MSELLRDNSTAKTFCWLDQFELFKKKGMNHRDRQQA
jgi:hypothetical protein